MSGPPSWVGDEIEDGDEDDSSSLTYYEKKFGQIGDDDGAFDPDTFTPNYTDTDIALAWARLVISSLAIVLGSFALWRFYHSRWILDIRTRSARLVLLSGMAVLLTMLVAINGSMNVIWGNGLRWFWTSLLVFFVTPLLYGGYICRALRLAVVFHPKAKRALPWLIPERNYLWFLTILGIAMLGIPIYHEYTLPVWKVIPKQTAILVHISLVFAGILVCLYPFIRKVDDLFNISTELIVATVALVLLGGTRELVLKIGGEGLQRWLGTNSTLFFSLFVFGFTVVDPLRRLAFDPLAATKRNYAERVLLSRREGRTSTIQTIASRPTSSRPISLRLPMSIGGGNGNGNGSEAEMKTTWLEEGLKTKNVPAVRAGVEEGALVGARHEHAGVTSVPWFATRGSDSRQYHASAVLAGDGGSGSRVGRGLGRRANVWDFERLASTPLLAAAFEDFAQKALCHESVLFLSEVSRYENHDYSTPMGGTKSPTQYSAFVYITATYIKDGSREEINISDFDKKRILNLYHKGEQWFNQEDEEEKRLVFGHAYVEVRDMLEANLLRRFLQTDQFKSVRAQRENMEIMMVSPNQQEL